MNSIIEIDNLSFAYEKRLILENINLKLEEKDFLVIVGPNGGGKTTLLKLILGLLKPSKGNITVLGNNPSRSRKLIGYVPQFGTFDKDFPISARDVVLTGLINKFSLLPWSNIKEKQKALEAMEAVNISHLSRMRFSNLSGGQKQRVLVARALISEPKLVVMDEPTASVDPTNEKDIYETLKTLNERLPIVLVSHDIAFVSKYVKKVGCLNKQLVVHNVDEVSSEGILTCYSHNVQHLQHKCNL